MRLAAIMRQAGLNVRFGTLDENIHGPVTIALSGGQKLVIEPLERSPRRLGLKNFDPCSILLNNDLSAGIPPVLQNLHEQYLLPPLHAGWAVRRKSTHFSCYDDVAKRFAKMVEIDPWMINPYFAHVADVDFQERTGEERLAAAIDGVLKKIARKYQRVRHFRAALCGRQIGRGHLRMGVMTVHDASEVAALTKRERTRMAAAKDGLEVRDVIVQEGVYTFERIGDEVAEPVVYMIDRYVVGGFYRVHGSRERNQNLNAPGMHFVPLGFEHTALPGCAREARRGGAEPLLHVWRRGAAGLARRFGRTRKNRPGSDSGLRDAHASCLTINAKPAGAHQVLHGHSFHCRPARPLQDLQGHHLYDDGRGRPARSYAVRVRTAPPGVDGRRRRGETRSALRSSATKPWPAASRGMRHNPPARVP